MLKRVNSESDLGRKSIKRSEWLEDNESGYTNLNDESNFSFNYFQKHKATLMNNDSFMTIETKDEHNELGIDSMLVLNHCFSNLSICEQPPTIEKKKNLTNLELLVGIIMLFLMVVPTSIIGPLTIGLPASNTFIKASWRVQGVAALSWIILGVMYALKFKGIDFKKDFSLKTLWANAKLAFCLNLWTLGYILGCSLTITSHADIMCCSSGVWIFFASVVLCSKIHKFEIAGYALYAVGVYFMFTDPFATKTGMDGQSYWGDLLPFLGAGACATLTYINKTSDVESHPMVKITHCFLFSSLYQLMLLPMFIDPKNIFSLDPVEGAFGWLGSFHSFLLVFVVNAFLTGIVGNLGFYLSFKYFSIEIIAGAMLLEPFFAQFLGVLIGQDEMPGIKTIIGLIVISAGFLLAGFGANKKQEEALMECNNEDPLDDENSFTKPLIYQS